MVDTAADGERPPDVRGRRVAGRRPGPSGTGGDERPRRELAGLRGGVSTSSEGFWSASRATDAERVAATEYRRRRAPPLITPEAVGSFQRSFFGARTSAPLPPSDDAWIFTNTRPRNASARPGSRCPRARSRLRPKRLRRLPPASGGTVVVKAQVHSGGRGKAGGVKLAADAAEAKTHARPSSAWTSRA